MSESLEKFSTCDLLKTLDRISEKLSKEAPDKMQEILTKYGGADMATKKVVAKAEPADYDPNAETPKASVEEDKKPAETSVSNDKDAKIGKAGEFAPGQDEAVSPGTQADVLAQILEAIQELKTMCAQMMQGDAEPQGQEVQDAFHPPVQKEAEAPAPAAPTAGAPISEKQIASIVVKAMEDKFKEFGIAKTEKPKVETGHPIEKTASMPSDMKSVAKMSWEEVHALNDRNRPKSFYEQAYGL